MSYVYPVGGQGANPVDNQYDAITIAADTTLEWPFSFTDSALITAQIMHVTASTTSLSLLMPDASQASVGQSIIIKNQGSNTFTVKDNAGGTIVSAAAGISYFIYITDNSTAAGAWATLTFGAGSNSISAASLAGNGLEASASLLQIDTPGSYKNANFSLGLNDRGSTIIWTGGVAAITVPSAASLGGSGYIVFFSNQGTGNAVFTTSGGELINGAASFTFAAGNSGVIICGAQAANEFVVVGFGQSVTFAFTQLIKDVSGSSNVTLTSSEQANKLIKLIGVLTGNIDVIVATTPDFFVVTNATSGAFAITVKTAAGTGVIASTGLSRTMICDGTNVLYANDVGTGTVTGVATGTGLTGGTITTSGTIELANTAVVAGTYGILGSPALTIDAQGRITAASDSVAGAWVVSAGTGDAITAAYSPAITALVDGQIVYFRASAANTIAAPTFSPNGLTARTITRSGGSAIGIGSIAGNLAEYALRYNLANTRWELLNPSIPYSPASASAPTSLTFYEQTTNGANTATLISPAALAADAMLTLPGVTGTLATLAGTEALTNKTLQDSTCAFVDDGDATKKLAFQCSGITTGTTRTVTIPDASGTMAYSYAPVTNSLGADVNLNSAVSYFDGPSVAQGTSGTWFVNGTATVYVSNFGANAVQAKLWDGTTVIASTSFQGPATGSAGYISIPLSGYIASPAANIRISVKSSGTSDKIIFNQSGNSKDSTITAIRVA